MSKLQLTVIIAGCTDTESRTGFGNPDISLAVLHYMPHFIAQQAPIAPVVMMVGFRICQQFFGTEHEYAVARSRPNPTLSVLNQYAYAFLRIVFIEKMTELITALSVGFGKFQTTTKSADPHPSFTVMQHTKDFIGSKRVRIICPVGVSFTVHIQAVATTSQPKSACGIFTKGIYVLAVHFFLFRTGQGGIVHIHLSIAGAQINIPIGGSSQHTDIIYMRFRVVFHRFRIELYGALIYYFQMRHPRIFGA